MSVPAVGHAWLPRATCDALCVSAGTPARSRREIVRRVAVRLVLALLLAPGLPLIAIPPALLLTKRQCWIVLVPLAIAPAPALLLAKKPVLMIRLLPA